LIRVPGKSNRLFEDQIAIRRAALKDGNRALGFPTITFPCEMASNLDMETMIAAMYRAKYGGIVVLSDLPARVSSRCCWNGSISLPIRSGP
jgi:CO dehydrogenase/acetyl-CoA synthase gamma subunit (corrinoid Fe-S protein)